MPLPKLPQPQNNDSFDLIVYEGTASGAGAAIAGARQGLKVLLVSEFASIGGMINSGVSVSDTGIGSLNNAEGFPNTNWISGSDLNSGFFEEFTQKVIAHYGGGDGSKYEPSVATQLLNEILEGAGDLYLLTPAKLSDLQMSDNKISSLSFGEMTFSLNEGGFVIDASNCVDLAVMAGVETTYGRESKSETGETFAGSLYFDNAAVYSDNKYQLLNSEEFPTTNDGDDKIQAYAYLMCIKDYGQEAPNLLKNPPPGYDEANYSDGSTFEQTWTYSPGDLPNNKYEVNVQPKGPDLQEANYDYLTGDRAAIREVYKNHALGYLYYIQNVWGLKNLGLAEDEYVENDNFPIRLYVREGRRLVGKYRMQEQDVMSIQLSETDTPGLIELSGQFKNDQQRSPLLYDSISYVSYAMDSHSVAKYPGYTIESATKGNGEFFLPFFSSPANVPLRCLVPDKGPDNLLVSQGVSATHVGFGALRLEAVRMGMGQAAGVYAALAQKKGLDNATIFTDDYKDYWNFLQAVQSCLVEDPNSLRVHFYRDMPLGYWAGEAVQIMSLWGIFSGFPDYYFQPDQLMTRAEFVKTIVLLIERFKDYLPEPGDTVDYPGYSDVNESDWFYPYVKQATEWGLVHGYPDGTFKPNDNILAADAAGVINNFYGSSLNNCSFTEDGSQSINITRAGCANAEYQVVVEKIFTTGVKLESDQLS